MESKWSISIAVVAVAISFLSLFHSFVATEFGVVFGKEDYDISIKNKLKVINTAGVMLLKPHVLVRNDGTIPLRINKVRALLRLGNRTHLYQNSFTKTVGPQSVWSDDVELGENLTDEEDSLRSALNMDIANYMLEQFHTSKDPEAPIFLDTRLMERIGAVLESNASWLKEDKNYYFLMLFWVNKDSDEPTVKLLYKFELDSSQRRMLTEYQKRGYLTPFGNIFKSNKFITFSAVTALKRINDNKTVEKTFEEYERLNDD